MLLGIIAPLAINAHFTITGPKFSVSRSPIDSLEFKYNGNTYCCRSSHFEQMSYPPDIIIHHYSLLPTLGAWCLPQLVQSWAMKTFSKHEFERWLLASQVQQAGSSRALDVVGESLFPPSALASKLRALFRSLLCLFVASHKRVPK